MRKIVGIIGLGEVGSAIKKIAEESGYEVLARDQTNDGFNREGVYCLHVCIPYKKGTFLKVIEKAAKDTNPKLVIIHSTIPVGIAREVFSRVGIPTIHSPIRGDHPDLYRSIKSNFVKYVAGFPSEAALLAKKHLKDLGIKKIKVVKDPVNTELGKLINTFTYAWSIILCKWIADLCAETGADFEIVYTDFIKTYNDGYRKKSPHVLQPILRPIPGPIGGHCLIPNAEILKPLDKYGFSEFLLKRNEAYKKTEEK